MSIELNITKFVNDNSFEGELDDDSLVNFSGSAMEHGQDVGRITWAHCAESVGPDADPDYTDMLPESEFDEYRDYIRDFGAWDDDEINGWSPVELRALIIQFIAGDLREACGYDSYAEYEADAKQGRCSGRAYKGDNGDWYYYIGS